MFILTEGNLLSSAAQALVNTVNCEGYMGKGLALQFKQMFPDNYHEYHNTCKQGKVVPGKMFVTEEEIETGTKIIINFPTKRQWRERSYLEDIESGLVDLVKVIHHRNISSIAIPPLGCGLGGLKWEAVKPLIERAFVELPDVDVYLFEPRKEVNGADKETNN